MKKYFILPVFALLILPGCKEESNEDIVQQPDRERAIETVLSVAHHEGYDLLTTTHKVWVKGTLSKTIITNDTLPDLGTRTTVEVDGGDGTVRQQEVRDNYELYITVQ